MGNESSEFDIREHGRDNDFDKALRPLSFSDFAGQDKMVSNLQVFVEAAKRRGEPLDHTLLHGPPGLGKTTLSNIVANELGVGFKVTSGTVLDKPGDLAGILMSLEKHDVLFIDEIHRLHPVVGIIERSARLLGVKITGEAAREIALRSRGTPRIANALLRRVRDFAMVKGNGDIDLPIARYALEALNIDRFGLDRIDNRILATIIDKFGGGPVGVSTIATAVGEDAGTIEDVYEPFLIMEGFLKRTPRGREATEKAWHHLGRVRPMPEGSLFDTLPDP